jgi:hypothetical protein
LYGWIKKGGSTPYRSRTPGRNPLFGPIVPRWKVKRVKIERKIIKEL